MSDDKVLVLSIDMNLFKASVSPPHTFLLSLDLLPAPSTPLDSDFLLGSANGEL